MILHSSDDMANAINRIAEFKAILENSISIDDIRLQFESFLYNQSGVVFDSGHIGDMNISWVGPQSNPSESVILFCHGGGYQIGSIKSHLNLMSRLSTAAGGRVLGFDYRLAPEHRFPAATEDAFAAYRWLLDSDIDPNSIVVAGDSAGAALALGVALQARDAGIAIPAGLVLISPWLDLTMRGDSYISRASVDVFSKPEQLAVMARTYLGRDGDPRHPLASPVEADLRGLPPILIHAGDLDITLDDSNLLAERARKQGVTVQLKIWPEMFHHFQVFPELPEAGQSLAEIGAFVRAHVA